MRTTEDSHTPLSGKNGHVVGDSEVHVLLVDDSPADIYLIKLAFKETAVPWRVSTVYTGSQAFAFLQRQGRFSDAIRPDLIVLDVNMPGMSGHEVLAALKADSDLRAIPVLMLSTSHAEEDLTRAYGGGAYHYLIKPSNFDGYLKLGRTITRLWQERALGTPAAS